VVKNWTHSNTLGRVNIKVAVSYDCDPDTVMEILSRCVAEHPGVLKQPPPAVMLTEFAASALNFEILTRFRAAGIEIPFPQRVVQLVGGSVTPGAPTRRAPE
jgi:small-conductance mechanosensitive channel